MANEFAALKPVESSMFSRAGYDDATWQLLFEFKSTHEVRAYKQVSPEVADECLSAKSIGSWWNQNVKGNPGWEYEILGLDPALQNEAPKPDKTSTEMNVLDEDIRRVEPGWNGKTIDPKPAEYPPSDAGAITMEKLQTAFVESLSTPVSDQPGFFAQKLEAQSAMTHQTHGEVMPKWETPENAVQALELMAEHESEIKAIISANLQTGKQALALKIIDQASRLQASEILDRLVSKKDTTVGLLDPFRKVLYDAYTYAGDKVKSAVNPLDEGVKHVKNLIFRYDQELERVRQQKIREANEKAEREARERQEAERQRLTLAEVSDALEQGDEQRAQSLFDNPVEVPKPYVQPEYIPPVTPAVAGQSARSNWKVVEEELDMVKFLRAVKDGSFPLDQAAQLVKFDLPELNRLAKALKKAFNVPGARAEDQGSVSVRRKK